VIKDCVVVIVFNNKKGRKIGCKLKEKIQCAESSGMAGHREYDVLNQCLGRLKQPGHVCGPVHGVCLNTSKCIGRGRV
jgi:hypothetical protein